MTSIRCHFWRCVFNFNYQLLRAPHWCIRLKVVPEMLQSPNHDRQDLSQQFCMYQIMFVFHYIIAPVNAFAYEHCIGRECEKYTSIILFHTTRCITSLSNTFKSWSSTKRPSAKFHAIPHFSLLDSLCLVYSFSLDTIPMEGICAFLLIVPQNLLAITTIVAADTNQQFNDRLVLNLYQRIVAIWSPKQQLILKSKQTSQTAPYWRRAIRRVFEMTTTNLNVIAALI